MTRSIALFCGVLVFAGITFPADAKPHCVRNAEVVRLDTLQISTCLWGDDGATPDSPVVVEIRQTLRNLSSKPIEIRLAQRKTDTFNLLIYAGDRDVALRESLGDPERDGGYVKKRYVELGPGERYELTAPLADLMSEPPRAGVKYRIVSPPMFDYRFLDEPKETAFDLRSREEAAKKKFVPFVRFENIEIR